MFSRKKFQNAWHTGAAKLKANCWRSNVGVTLYATRIVDWSTPGVVKLYTGGYRTVSTKTHMNEVLKHLFNDVHVYQKNGTWYVNVSGVSHEFTEGFEVSK